MKVIYLPEVAKNSFSFSFFFFFFGFSRNNINSNSVLLKLEWQGYLVYSKFSNVVSFCIQFMVWLWNIVLSIFSSFNQLPKANIGLVIWQFHLMLSTCILLLIWLIEYSIIMTDNKVVSWSQAWILRGLNCKFSDHYLISSGNTPQWVKLKLQINQELSIIDREALVILLLVAVQ